MTPYVRKSITFFSIAVVVLLTFMALFYVNMDDQVARYTNFFANWIEQIISVGCTEKGKIGIFDQYKI